MKTKILLTGIVVLLTIINVLLFRQYYHTKIEDITQRNIVNSNFVEGDSRD